VRAGVGLAAALLLTLPAGQAVAGPTHVCRVIPDVRGDAGYRPLDPASETELAPGTSDDDLLSGDVASDGRRLTAVWRMGRVATPDPVAPMGRAYTLVFSVQSRGSWFLAARTFPTGPQYVYGEYLGGVTSPFHLRVLGEARGRLDPSRGLVVVDAPASAFAGGLRRGAVLRALQASVSRWVGQGIVPAREVGGLDVPLTGVGLPFDNAKGGHYVVGSRSCVHPGL
jgi:hypothetical protein